VTDTLPSAEPLILVDADQPTVIRNSVVVSAAAPGYTIPGYQLVATTVLGATTTTRSWSCGVRARLAALHRTPTARWDLLATFPIGHACRRCPRRIPLRRRVRVAPGLYVCGDHRDTSSIQGALVSGRRAASAVLTDLAVTAPF
jgi:hypothetical protein